MAPECSISRSEKDLIRQIAEHAEGAEKYLKIREKSEEWKSTLFSLGDTQQEIIDRLHASGMKRTNQAIRGWLNDAARIGPADYEDVVTIAASADDSSLATDIDHVWSAIKGVRGIHMAAGMELSRLLVEHLPAVVQDLEALSQRLTVIGEDDDDRVRQIHVGEQLGNERVAMLESRREAAVALV